MSFEQCEANKLQNLALCLLVTFGLFVNVCSPPTPFKHNASFSLEVKVQMFLYVESSEKQPHESIRFFFQSVVVSKTTFCGHIYLCVCVCCLRNVRKCNFLQICAVFVEINHSTVLKSFDAVKPAWMHLRMDAWQTCI